MLHKTKRTNPEIERAFHLFTILNLKEQILFLDNLIKEKDMDHRKALIDRTLNGGQVWKEKKAI